MALEVPIAKRVRGLPPPLPPPDGGQGWPRQGDWTYEDYLRLPDDGRRYEIIEGVLYVTNAPDFAHQYAVQQIASEIMSFGSGIVFTSPFEVHLPGIAKPVQPDMLFIAAEQRPPAGARFFEGVPALIVEGLFTT